MFIFEETNKYPQIKCAFFSRKKGISNGIYKSLNCGLNSNDKKSNILKNRIIALKKIGLNKKKLIIPNQTHSNKIKIVDEKLFQTLKDHKKRLNPLTHLQIESKLMF